MRIKIRQILVAALLLPFLISTAWGQATFIDRFDLVTPANAPTGVSNDHGGLA